MKITCENNNHSSNNYISCCLTDLLTLKHKYDSIFQSHNYATLFLRTLSHCNKIFPLSSLSIPYPSLISLLNAITYCASLFYFSMHYSYSKFLILLGLQLSNSTNDKNKREIKKRKAALFNIISCIYLKEQKLSKAIKYANKSLKYSHSKMDKAIAHNNITLIYLSLLENNSSNNTTFVTPETIIENSELSYSKIAPRLNKEYKRKSNKKKSKRESIALLVVNYICIIETIDAENKQKVDITKLVQKGYDYCSKTINNNNYLTLFFKSKLTQSDNEIIVLTPKGLSDDKVNKAVFPTITISREKKLIHTPLKPDIKLFSDFNICNSAVKINVNKSQLIPNANDFFFHKSESTPSSFMSITNAKNIKGTQNYFFSLDNKQKQPKKGMMSLFTPQISQTILSPKSTMSSKSAKPNPFDDLMKKLNDNTKAMKEFNDNYKSVEPTPKIIINERKRNTLQFNINPNQNLLEVKSLFCTQNVNKKVTELFKDLIISYEEELIHYPQYIEQCLNYEQYDITTNYYQCKCVNDAYEYDYLRKLFSSNNQQHQQQKQLKQYSNDTFCIKYISNKEDYSIYIKNNLDKALIQITITFDITDKKIEEEYSYDDLSREINQIFFWNSMPIHCYITFITNTSILIEQILIHHFQLLKSLDKIELSQVGILSHPITFPFMLFEFEFFNTVCRCNFHIRKYYIILLIVSSNDESIYLRFNITMDASSFNILFKQNTFSSDPNIENVILIPTYSPLSPDSCRNLLIDFLIKVQEIIKHNFSMQPCSFNDLVKLSEKSIYKIIFEDSLSKKELYILSHNLKETKWVIDYYSISIIEISDSALYMHKILELTLFDFSNIIGIDPNDGYSKMNKKNVIITHNILLNTVKLRNIMMKILTEENYDAIIRLVRIKPVSLFLFKSVLFNMKKYYCCSFEFLIYSNEMYFIRIIAMESSICRTYVKIYLPYFFICDAKDIDNIKIEIGEKYSFIKSSDKRKMQNMLQEEVLLMLTKEVELDLYDNINGLIIKLNADSEVHPTY